MNCPCRVDMDCWCPPKWDTVTAEEFADAISAMPHNICVMKDGRCANPDDCHCARLEPKPGEAW